MKIRINAEETYEFKVPEEILKEQLQELIFRLNGILKLFPQDPLLKEIKNGCSTMTRRGKWNLITKNRANALKFMKLWKIDKSQAKEFLNSLNIDIQTFNNASLCSYISKFRIKMNITNREIEETKI